MIDNNCIFCKIINKKIPAEVVYEDDRFLAFLDINPIQLGHILVIPKEHYIWMQETPDEIIGKIFIICKKVMLSLKKTYTADFIKVKVIGNEVPHFHIHLIPQYLNSPSNFITDKKYKNSGEMSVHAQKIKNNI